MQHDAPTESEATRLDRRQAMKAALGGAAAAAVFTAPRIEGFSTAPNYASAVTTPACANANGNATLNKTSEPCGFFNNWDCCWGGRNGSTCDPAIVGTTTVTPQVELPPYNVPTLEASEESLKQFSPADAGAAKAVSAPVLTPPPTSYPPLESPAP